MNDRKRMTDAALQGMHLNRLPCSRAKPAVYFMMKYPGSSSDPMLAAFALWRIASKHAVAIELSGGRKRNWIVVSSRPISEDLVCDVLRYGYLLGRIRDDAVKKRMLRTYKQIGEGYFTFHRFFWVQPVVIDERDGAIRKIADAGKELPQLVPRLLFLSRKKARRFRHEKH